MKCIVINLDRAVDRRERVTREFESRGLEFELSKAKDKLELSEFDCDKYANSESKLMNWNTSAVPGEIACWISHQQVWRTCLEDEKIDVVAVFEDDAVLADHINLALDALESASNYFDIVSLENRFPKSEFKSLIDIGSGFALGLVKYRNSGTTGYVITRNAMRQLINKFPLMTAHIDLTMHSSWLNGLRTFTLSPITVYHRSDSYSFIQSDSVRSGGYSRAAFRIARDRFFFKIRKRWLLRIPERIEYYRRTRIKRSIQTGSTDPPPD